MKHHYTDLQLELVRKFFHILTGVLIVLAFNARILDIWLFGLLIIIFSATMLYNMKAERELITKVLSINRADAKIPGINILFYFIGCFIVLAVFPLKIASAAILILAFGDAAAHLVAKTLSGSLLSKKNYNEGTFAGMIAGSLAAWLYVQLPAAIIAAVCAMIVEAGELRIANHTIDDNLLIPIIAGTTLWLLSIMFTSIPMLMP